ncbi:hypothetical protein TeGR_g7623, partial [Tetraparma gracilis]
MAGDLCYLEIKTPSDGVVNVTASPTGFFVNNTVAGKSFSPERQTGNAACFEHDLLSLLLRKCPKFKQSWKNTLDLLQRTAAQNQAPPGPGYENPLAAIAAVSNEEGKMALPSWLATPPVSLPHSTSSYPHPYNPARAEAALTSTFGAEDAGTLRDWNEELQTAREMEADTMDARLMRARMIHKTLTDFSDAATQGVVAIGQGEIAAVNLNEPESTRVFVFNSIFFSVAGDTQDTFKATRGTAAYRKTVNKDVASMGLLHQVDAQTGLSSFATCIVDYFGTRYVAQSVAPGILSFDASSESSKFLEHGAVDNSKPLKTTDEMQ